MPDLGDVARHDHEMRTLVRIELREPMEILVAHGTLPGGRRNGDAGLTLVFGVDAQRGLGAEVKVGDVVDADGSRVVIGEHRVADLILAGVGRHQQAEPEQQPTDVLASALVTCDLAECLSVLGLQTIVEHMMQIVVFANV